MARIKLELPKQFLFQTTIPVRITDVNYGGHVGNDAILSLIHEARMQFLQSHAYTELQIEHVGLIMSDVAIEFKTELFYGDAVTVDVTATEFSRVGFEIYYRLVSIKNTAVVAVAKTGMICYDYSMRKIVGLPQAVIVKLSN
ncbi:MAG: thioesterase family protein [Bacteroidota bacterium]